MFNSICRKSLGGKPLNYHVRLLRIWIYTVNLRPPFMGRNSTIFWLDRIILLRKKRFTAPVHADCFMNTVSCWIYAVYKLKNLNEHLKITENMHKGFFKVLINSSTPWIMASHDIPLTSFLLYFYRWLTCCWLGEQIKSIGMFLIIHR